MKCGCRARNCVVNNGILECSTRNIEVRDIRQLQDSFRKLDKLFIETNILKLGGKL